MKPNKLFPVYFISQVIFAIFVIPFSSLSYLKCYFFNFFLLTRASFNNQLLLSSLISNIIKTLTHTLTHSFFKKRIIIHWIFCVKYAIYNPLWHTQTYAICLTYKLYAMSIHFIPTMEMRILRLVYFSNQKPLKWLWLFY